MSVRASIRPHLHHRRFGRELVSTLVFLVAVYTLLEMALPRSVVLSISMQPNLVESQRLVISRVSYLLGEPQRGEIVVFNAPNAQPDEPPLIKRLIGLPGETVQFLNGAVSINGVKLEEPYIKEPCEPGMCPDRVWQLGPDEYFFMGDNRNHSHDSRAFGPVHRQQIIGRAVLRYWPPEVWGILSFTYGDHTVR
ncbi:MAG: signal peptidase I [Chloroflexi bacterium]|nr:signal peptidase I [Chloroflexota bacterium]